MRRYVQHANSLQCGYGGCKAPDRPLPLKCPPPFLWRKHNSRREPLNEGFAN